MYYIQENIVGLVFLIGMGVISILLLQVISLVMAFKNKNFEEQVKSLLDSDLSDEAVCNALAELVNDWEDIIE